jgi:hypothetical protein
VNPTPCPICNRIAVGVGIPAFMCACSAALVYVLGHATATESANDEPVPGEAA